MIRSDINVRFWVFWIWSFQWKGTSIIFEPCSRPVKINVTLVLRERNPRLLQNVQGFFSFVTLSFHPYCWFFMWGLGLRKINDLNGESYTTYESYIFWRRWLFLSPFSSHPSLSPSFPSFVALSCPIFSSSLSSPSFPLFSSFYSPSVSSPSSSLPLSGTSTLCR